MGYKTTLLLVLAAFSYANAFMSLIPEGKELIYHYHGLLTTGTAIPAMYASSFVLDGKLHMQTDRNSTFMKFSDLKFKMDNGRYDDWHEFEATEIPLPEDLEDFHKVFQVVYDADGEAMGLKTESMSGFTVNFQKAIGSMMQLDMKKVDLESKRPHAFHDMERNLYGKGKVYYNVMPSKDSMRVEKLMEMRSGNVGKFMLSNLRRAHCDRPVDHPLTRDSQRFYNIVKKDSVHVIEDLEANGGIYFHPYQGQSTAFHVYVNQSMQLLSMEPIKTKLACTAEKFHEGFDYQLRDMSETSTSLPDISFGRRKWNTDKLLIQIEKMIMDSVQYLKEFHLNMKQPDIKHGQLIIRMTRLMLQLETDGFNKLYEAIMKLTEGDKNKQYLQIYLEMIPLIGSKASMEHMMRLIKEKKVKEEQALRMLQNMGLNAKAFTKELIEEMSEMMNWGEEYSMLMRKAGIFCFSNLLMKATVRERLAAKHQHKTEFGSLSEMSEEEKLLFPDSKYYEKYILEMVKRMKAAEDQNTRLLYLHALFNTKFDSIVEHLTPIIKGEMWDDDYLRLVAAIVVKPMISRNEELVFELYWPMMTDDTLPLSTRVFIYYLIMESNPPLSRMINIYWHMLNEKDNAMYQFHYTYLKNKAETLDNCSMDFRLKAKQLLKYTQRPHIHGLTGFHRIDYYQTKYGYSQNIEWMYAHSDRTKDTERIFRVSFGNEFNGLATKTYTIFMRVSGMEEFLLDRLRLQINEAPSHLFNFKDMQTFMKELENNEHFKMNIVLMKFDQIVMSINVGHENIADLLRFTGMWIKEQTSSIQKFMHINYEVSTTILIPTEIGFLAAYQRYIPRVHYFDWDIKKETVNNLITYKIDAEMKIWSHGRLGLSVYNPIVDVWQGVNKYHSYDSQYPLLMDVTINPQQQSAKFSLKRHGKMEEDTLGCKSHVTTLVFVKDDSDRKILQKCSPKSENFVMVTNGDEFRRDYTLFEKDNSNTGFLQTIRAFDSERYLAENSIKHFHELIGFKTLKHYRTILGDYLLNVISAMTYNYIQPEPATNGFLYTYVPSKQFPITQNDLTIRMNNEYKQGEWLLLPGMKINMRANYVLKNKEKTVKTWDINMLVDMNIGHTVKTMKMQIVRMIPGQKEYRICIDAQKKWLKSTIEGKMTMAATHSGEDKCGKDDIFMEIESTGEQLEDQKLHKLNHVECMDRIWSDIHEEQSMHCYAAQSSVRRYTWNVKMHEVPVEFRNFFMYVLDGLKSHYRHHLMHSQDPSVKLEKDNIQIVIEYPMMSVDEAHLTMSTPNSEYRMVSVPMNNWLALNIHRGNLHYNRLLKMMYYMGMTDMCFVSQNSMTPIDGHVVPMKMTTEYTLLMGDSLEDCKNGVWGKKLEGTDKIAVKFVHKDHSLEIIPKSDDDYEVLLDGKKMEELTHSEEWMYYNLSKETRVMNILMHRMGGHYLFDGHHIRMDLPKLDMELFGLCVKV